MQKILYLKDAYRVGMSNLGYKCNNFSYQPIHRLF